MPQGEDKAQIGLTTSGSAALQLLMDAGLFAAEGDAYKLGVAYALAKELPIASAPEGGYQTKFNAAGGLDRDGTLRDLIAVLCPEYSSRPYGTAERLAELGVVALAKRISAHESLADILNELRADAE